MSVIVTNNTPRVSIAGSSVTISVAPNISIIQIGSGGASSIDAENVAIEDAGNYYTSDNVEGALQEVGADIADIVEPQSGQGTTVQPSGAVDIGGAMTTAQTIALSALGKLIVSGLGVEFGLGPSEIYMYLNEAGVTFASDYARIQFKSGAVFGRVEMQSDGRIVINAFNGVSSITSEIQHTAPSKYGNDFDSVHDADGYSLPSSRWVLAKVNTVAGTVTALAARVTTAEGNIATLQGQVSTNTSSISSIQSTLTGYSSTFTTLQYRSAIQTLTNSSGIIAWDFALGINARITLSASGTLQNPTNVTATTNAIFPSLEVIQDGTGGRVLSFDTNYVLPSGYVAPQTAANSRVLYNFYLRSDGKIGVTSTYYTS